MTSGSIGVDVEDLAALYSRCLDAAEPGSGNSEDAAGAASHPASPSESSFAESLSAARVDSVELGGHAPDPVGTSTLRLLAAMSGKRSAVYVGSAPGVVSLALLAGLSSTGENPVHGTVTAITSDPHHAEAGKKAVASAGYPAGACRIIAARPLEVMGKLASDSYGLVVADAGEVEASALAERGLALVGGGAVVVLGSTTFFDDVDGLPGGARITRLPLSGGLSVLTA